MYRYQAEEMVSVWFQPSLGVVCFRWESGRIIIWPRYKEHFAFFKLSDVVHHGENIKIFLSGSISLQVPPIFSVFFTSRIYHKFSRLVPIFIFATCWWQLPSFMTTAIIFDVARLSIENNKSTGSLRHIMTAHSMIQHSCSSWVGMGLFWYL